MSISAPMPPSHPVIRRGEARGYFRIVFLARPDPAVVQRCRGARLCALALLPLLEVGEGVGGWGHFVQIANSEMTSRLARYRFALTTSNQKTRVVLVGARHASPDCQPTEPVWLSFVDDQAECSGRFVGANLRVRPVLIGAQHAVPTHQKPTDRLRGRFSPLAAQWRGVRGEVSSAPLPEGYAS